MPASLKSSRPGTTRKKLVLFVEEGGGDWHARQLVAALEARDANVVVTTLTACAFDTRMPSGLDIPGFDGALPDGAFVRAISTGSLEQITFRLGILHALRESGVRVWNDARTIERCVDKSTATFLFQKAGLPVPETRVLEQRDRALRYAETMQTPFVLKPMFGSQGNGVRRVDAAAQLPVPDEVGDVYYLQNYLRAKDATSFSDLRIFVIGGKVLAAMARMGSHWVTNVHQGGKPHPYEITPEAASLAIAAADAIGADYAGVDLIEDDSSGRLMVLEINSNPAWKGLHSVSPVNIADALAEAFIAALIDLTPDQHEPKSA